MRIDGISVVVTCFNGAPWIRGALTSVLQQKVTCPLELVVVDDHSQDDTADVVRSLNDPRIRLFCNQTNMGVAAARNFGVSQASHEWLAFNDQDDVWLGDKLARQCEVLETHPELDGVAGGYARLAHDGQSRWTGRVLHKRWSPSHSPRLEQAPRYQPALHGPCYIQSLLIRKAVLSQVGGFREDLPIAYDPDLFLRLGEVAQLGAIEAPVFLYRLTASSITGSADLSARQFLGGFAYMYAAQRARAQGHPEPDVAGFFKQYQPGASEVQRFVNNQVMRSINTTWVNQGLWRAMLAAVVQMSRHPSVAASLASRLRWWAR